MKVTRNIAHKPNIGRDDGLTTSGKPITARVQTGEIIIINLELSTSKQTGD
jgi:hypothetical protein